MIESDPLLAATDFLDYQEPSVRAFVARATADARDERERAVALYYAVRDDLRYEIYDADLSRGGMRASSVIAARSGLCIHKSIVYAAAVRAVGIPSRLVLTDVRNHLASPRLKDFIGGDVFHYHCLVAVRLGGTWLKVTPVFNRRLCQLYGMAPLDFDGTGDSLHHPYDDVGKRYMEFVREHGAFDDLPYETIVAGMRAAHPRLFAGADRLRSGALAREAPDALNPS
ncbi:transglutaminase-like domain-containing protein [Marinivivus vitaminiproducens]|uniref:transglutaminase-like domain-containing protein n=1 Tax=Marinivivus vitaminiproducens TaxID=3035935 RepID=UPI0027A6F3D2|nr:transglutaminase-like domain-containing protein [Geminicoccaceae bacterium SCSIO 64248]